MRKNIIYVLLLSLVVACTDQFEEINTNKNQPTAAQPKTLLPNIIFNLANANVSSAFDFGDIVSQYGGNYEYNQLDLYDWGADDRFWNMYKWLNDVQDIKKQAISSGEKNYEAIALILESYIISSITDAYGNVPYTEAASGEQGILKPVYDSQEEIYAKIFENLTQANQLIDTNKSVEGDRLFGGSMIKWKKFANSLHVRYLMRVSNKINVSSRLETIVSNVATYPLFTSNEDNATYSYSGSFPDISPMTDGVNRLYGYNIVVPTTHLVNNLMSNNDPRLNEWIDPIAGTNDHRGLVPGLPSDAIGEPSGYSRRAESYFYEKSKIEALLMTFSELNFLLAEARERNLISTGTAQNYYNTAVAASFAQWGVTMPSDFLTTTAPYAANSDTFYVQKWLALYHSGVESWLDWKRTGKPSFIVGGPGAKNGGLVPRRILLPSLEQSVNAENYEKAVQDMGGETINTKVWWDNY